MKRPQAQQNQIALLEEQLKSEIKREGLNLEINEYFAYFCNSQILKDLNLSADQIESGIVDGGGDGGIDSIYLFVNGTLIQDVAEILNIVDNIRIDIYIIQDKFVTGFTQSAISKMRESFEDLFSMGKDLESMKEEYNDALRDKASIFREIYNKYMIYSPNINFNFGYATKATQVHKNIEAKVKKLKTSVQSIVPRADFDFKFYDCKKLLELSKKSKQTKKQLFARQSIGKTVDNCYVFLVKLQDYYSFITDNGVLESHFFEANVRDYQDGVAVNQSIANTLNSSESGLNFWWLNNGVTITADKVELEFQSLVLTNPRIVNGMQTSHEIFNYFNINDIVDHREVMIRVIQVDDEAKRLQIITATNNQTRIKAASLKTVSLIHWQIEQRLLKYDLYYDRRQNFYRNKGIERKKIIDIFGLAQSVIAILLSQPDFARARPSNLINEDDTYNQIFNEDYNLDLYYKSISIVKKCENYIKEKEPKLVTNLRYHLSFFVTAMVLGKLDIKPVDLSEIDLSKFTNNQLESAFVIVKDNYIIEGGKDSISKSSDFTFKLIEALKRVIESKNL